MSITNSFYIHNHILFRVHVAHIIMVGWQRAVSSGEPANSYSDMANTTERRRQKLTPEGMEEILSNGDEDDVEEDEIIEFQQKPPELARTAEHDRDEPSQNGNMNGSGYGDLLPHQQEDKTKAQHGSAIGEKKGLYCETGCVLLAFFGLVRISIITLTTVY